MNRYHVTWDHLGRVGNVTPMEVQANDPDQLAYRLHRLIGTGRYLLSRDFEVSVDLVNMTALVHAGGRHVGTGTLEERP